MKYKIIDSHAHIFPEKIAKKAAESIGEFYNIEMCYDGTVEGLIRNGNKIGVSKYVVHSTATKVSQVLPINDYIIEAVASHDCFIGFGTLCPGMDKRSIYEEVDRIISKGLKGIKLHPDFQNFNIDALEVMDIYEACEGKIPILCHVGDKRYDRSSPTRLLRVVEKFKDLTVIAAHLGGYTRWDEAKATIIGHPRVYIDTCSALPFLSPREATDIIKLHGVERVLFAVDYPMWDHEEELARFNRLDLSEDMQIDIFAKNIERLLQL